MAWQWILVTFGFGLFIGYLLCDLINTENKITYHIKRLRAREGAAISVDAVAEQKKPRRRPRKNSAN